MSECMIDGCVKPIRARGWCAMHWLRWRRHGDLEHGRSTDTNYSLIHLRLRKQRGKASEHKCQSCGNQAQDWSYTGGDPEERSDVAGPNAGKSFSLDQDYYEPMCRSCHSQRDAGGSKHRCAKLTEDQVVAIRAEWESGAKPTDLGPRYGVTASTVSRIVHGRNWKHLLAGDRR